MSAEQPESSPSQTCEEVSGEDSELGTRPERREMTTLTDHG